MQFVEHPDEVGKRGPQAIDGPDHHHITLPPGSGLMQGPELGPTLPTFRHAGPLVHELVHAVQYNGAG